MCVGGKEYTGLATVLLALASTSKEPAKWSTKEQEAAVYQWLEFASLYGQTTKTNSQQTKNILKVSKLSFIFRDLENSRYWENWCHFSTKRWYFAIKVKYNLINPALMHAQNARLAENSDYWNVGKMSRNSYVCV